MPNADEALVELIVDLLTFRGRAPQGCVSTPYIFNLVARPLDQHLKLLMKQFRLNALTRYSDNICLSSLQPIGFDGLERQIRRLVRGNGFEISWVQHFTHQPFVYLGTEIFCDRLGLAQEKYGQFCDRLLEAINNPTPGIYESQVRGIWAWAFHICGHQIPPDLVELLGRYFEKVGRAPKALVEIRARRLERRMF